MKIIYMNCGVKNYMEEDHHSYIYNFCSGEKKAFSDNRSLPHTVLAQAALTYYGRQEEPAA